MRKSDNLLERHRDIAACEDLLELAIAEDGEARSAVIELMADGINSRRTPHTEALVKSFWKSSKALVKALDAGGPDYESDIRQLLLDALPLGSCELVQAMAVESYLRRLQGRYGCADEVIKKAWTTAKSCSLCQADLLWRRADLRGYQKRYQEGLEDVDSAVRIYEDLGCSGHTLDHEGKANSLLVRGMLLCDLGDLCGSIDNFGRVLQILSPSKTPDLFAYTVVNLAIPLRDAGPEGRGQALKLIAVARQKFRGVMTGSLPRAKLDWLEGSLKLSIKHRYPKRWRELLHRAMKDFARMGMDAEAMAVMADLAHVEFPDVDSIRGLLIGPEIRSLVISARFRDPLSHLLNVSKERSFHAFGRVKAAITGLRQVAEETPGVLPCFVSTP